MILSTPQRTGAGFTLIELLITVAIMAIIAAIGLPQFNDYLKKGRRPDAKALLLEMASKQEIFYSVQRPNSYSDTLVGLGYGADPQLSEQGYYSVTLTTTPFPCDPDPATADPACTGFTLTATPVATGPQAGPSGDVGCGSFTLDNFGVKGRTGTDPLDSCW